MDNELIEYPVKKQGQYHIIDNSGIRIGCMEHPDLRDYVIELMNAHIPNKETIEAIEETEKGEGLHSFNNAEELIEELNS